MAGVGGAVRILCVALVWPLVLIGAAQAQDSPSSSTTGVPKFALVIGNSNYAGYRRNLKNAINDSKLIAQALRKLGFKVQQNTDMDRSRMITVVTEFADNLPEGATAMVFMPATACRSVVPAIWCRWT